jgi:hypothetical protein
MRWALVLPAVVAVASCDEPGVHILTGQLYDPMLGCVGPSNSIDVVSGPSAGDGCDPQCLLVGDASAVYVTTVCPPYPGDYHSEAEDAAADAADPCVGAFAAYAAYDGADCPPFVPDAGDEGDDGGEAGAGDDGGGSAADGAMDGPATD